MMETEKNNPFTRREADGQIGLNQEEIELRKTHGAINHVEETLTRSVKEIIFENVFTLFNFLNLGIAIALILIGRINNVLFLGVAVSNSLMGIIQELRSKRTIDKLSIVARSKAHVVREGNLLEIDQNELVLDDVVILKAGNQIVVDGIVISEEGLEVDESLLTGEADAIFKHAQDQLMSGSFVVAGQARMRVMAVGQDGFAAKLAQEAKKEKRTPSQLMKTLNGIIKALTFVIIPLGIIYFTMQINRGHTVANAILSVSAPILGMIPEGLILLTSVTFAVGALNLARKKTLVQSLTSIETLARVDVLCLDKTGTITDGSLEFTKLEPMLLEQQSSIEIAIQNMMSVLDDENQTANALRDHYGPGGNWRVLRKIPFASKRKWSAVSFEEEGSYIMGAYEFIVPESDPAVVEKIETYTQQGYRVLVLAQTIDNIEGEVIPDNTEVIGLLVFSDHVREEAKATFAYFRDEGVTLKVISGDHPQTVSHIAHQAGIEGSEHYVDMSKVEESADYQKLVKENTVFGRVTPHQKRALVQALQQLKHTVCMTGDGVNDVLALREADCSVAMVGGSDAARSVADFVLLTSNFDAMIDVLKEGRRVINNIERFACLYLVKTIYSAVLAIISLFFQGPYPYLYLPIQLTPINSLTVGIPSFFLALRRNYRRPEGKFVKNIISDSVPAAFTIILNIILIQVIAHLFGLSHVEMSTMCIIMIGVVGVLLLLKITAPQDRWDTILISLILAAMALVFIFFYSFFELEPLISRTLFFVIPLGVEAYYLFHILGVWIDGAYDRFVKRRRRRLEKRTHD